MIKAVFLDYTGTILQQRGADMDALVTSVISGSTINTKDEVLAWWHKSIRALKAECYKETYYSYENLLGPLGDMAKMEIRYKDSGEIQNLIRNYWMYAPVYDDAKEFFDLCPLPIYVLSENRRDYIRVCLRRNDMHVNGILSSDDVAAYAPHEEFYQQAVDYADCLPQEAVYVSEDYEACVDGARREGLQGILLDRRSSHRDVDGRRIRSLVELLPLIRMENSRKE